MPRRLLVVAALFLLCGFIRSGFVANSTGNGFTTFVPTTGTGICARTGTTYTGGCIAYADTVLGNDTTCAPQAPPVTLTPSLPCATIAKASSFIRDGHDDWTLLKAGQTFTDDLISSGANTSYSGSGMVVSPSWSTVGSHIVSGVILFGVYGTGARPIVKASFTTMNAQRGSYFQRQASTTNSNIAVNGWEFYAYTRDPANPSYVAGDSNQNPAAFSFVNSNSITNWLLEDNKFSYFANSFSYGTVPYGVYLDNLIFRRNIVQFQYIGGNQESQGMYVAGARTLMVIEENFFNSNGWLNGVSGASPNLLNHNIYNDIINPANTIYRGNILCFDYGAAQFRQGGVIYNNLFCDSAPTMSTGINQVTMTYNVVQETADRPSPNSATIGSGLDLNPAMPGSLIDHNIVTNSVSSSPSFGIKVEGTLNGPTGNFTSGSPTISNVNTSSESNESWPTGLPITGSLIPPNTTVLSQSFNGTTGSITMSNNATGNGTATAFAPFNLNQTVSNNIVYNQNCGTPGSGCAITDNGTGTTLTSNCMDPAAANNNPSGSGCSSEPYPAPSRSIETYDSVVLGGPGTVADFLNQGGSRSLGSWPLNLTANGVNNYIRQGFNVPLQ